jgi:hypothetical protein
MARHSFLLHAAHLAVNHSLNDEVSGTIEVDLGTDAVANSYAYGSNIVDIQEAYATYAPGGFSLVAGKFATYEGIEVMEGPANPTLTRGYLYGLAEAFTHTGVKAHYGTDMFDLGVSVVNGWDNIVDDNGSKMVGFRLGVTPNDTFGAGLSGYAALGSEDGDSDDGLVSIDLTGSIAATEALTIWFQGNFGRMNGAPGADDPSWFGFGVQPVATFAEIWSFGGRVEFMSDGEGARTGIAEGKFLNLTLTPGVTLGEGFTTRLEYRADLSLGDDAAGAKDIFLNPDDGSLNSSQHTLGLGAHYVF